jgi:hypothetical protein
MHGPTEAAPAVIVAGRRCPATLSTSEAAAWLGVSVDVLRQRHVKDGPMDVKPVRLGRNLRWPTLLVAHAAGLPARVELHAAPSRPDAADAQVHELASGG